MPKYYYPSTSLTLKKDINQVSQQIDNMFFFFPRKNLRTNGLHSCDLHNYDAQENCIDEKLPVKLW